MDVGNGSSDIVSLTPEHNNSNFKKVALFVCYTAEVIAVPALVATIISAVVLWRLGRRQVFNRLLWVLTMTDAVYIVVCIVFAALRITSIYIGHRNDTISHGVISVECMLYPLTRTLYKCETFITTLVGVHRCIVIGYPLHVRQLESTSGFRWSVFVTFVVAIALEIPLWVQYDHKVCPEHHEAANWLTESIGKTRTSAIIYYTFTGISLVFPTAIMIGCNIYMERMLRLHKKTSPNPAGLSDTRKVTILTLIITCTSVVINILRLTVVVLFATKPPTKGYDIAFAMVSAATGLLTMINSCINIIFYCLFGRKFKDEVVKLFCTKERKKQQTIKP